MHGQEYRQYLGLPGYFLTQKQDITGLPYRVLLFNESKLLNIFACIFLAHELLEFQQNVYRLG